MRRPGTRRLLARLMDLVDLGSRAELVHVLGCGDCYLFDACDGGGPHFCAAFLVEFRGYVAPDGDSLVVIPELWGSVILAALQRDVVFGRRPGPPSQS